VGAVAAVEVGSKVGAEVEFVAGWVVVVGGGFELCSGWADGGAVRRVLNGMSHLEISMRVTAAYISLNPSRQEGIGTRKSDVGDDVCGESEGRAASSKP
jgi:hypothetical protein